MSDATIGDYYVEERTFPPPADFAAAALTSDRSLYEEAEADFEAFWARQARELLTWDRDFTETLAWDLPFARWFADGRLNVSANCLDRHVEAGWWRQGRVLLGGASRATHGRSPTRTFSVTCAGSQTS